jgi:hypothetical protein
VVATGFDGRRVGVSESIASDRIYTPNPYIVAEEDKENKEQMAKKKSKISPLKQAQSEPAQKKTAEAEEADELGIPAFIRKKMM